MSIVLCCIRKVSGNFQQPGLSAKGGTDSCYVNVATATRSSYKYSHIYALLINFILLGDNSNEHYSMEKEITLSKTKKFFLIKITGQLKNIVFYTVEQARELSITKKGQCHEFVAPPLFFLDSNPSCPG